MSHKSTAKDRAAIAAHAIDDNIQGGYRPGPESHRKEGTVSHSYEPRSYTRPDGSRATSREAKARAKLLKDRDHCPACAECARLAVLGKSKTAICAKHRSR